MRDEMIGQIARQSFQMQPRLDRATHFPEPHRATLIHVTWLADPLVAPARGSMDDDVAPILKVKDLRAQHTIEARCERCIAHFGRSENIGAGNVLASVIYEIGRSYEGEGTAQAVTCQVQGTI